MKCDLTYDAANHEYKLNGFPVPSVTQIIKAVLGSGYPDSPDKQWRMERGRAIHACVALIAQGKQFTNDPAIDGYVAAARKWFADNKPTIVQVEQPVANVTFQYAGTPDLVCRSLKAPILVDWKSCLEPERAKLQLAFYSLCFKPPIKWGIAVELREDSTYKTPGLWDLRRAQQEALAIRTVYNIKLRLT